MNGLKHQHFRNMPHQRTWPTNTLKKYIVRQGSIQTWVKVLSGRKLQAGLQCQKHGFRSSSGTVSLPRPFNGSSTPQTNRAFSVPQTNSRDSQTRSQSRSDIFPFCQLFAKMIWIKKGNFVLCSETNLQAKGT